MLGPLIIKKSWVVILAGLIAGFIFLRFYPVQEKNSDVQEVLLNGMIYFVLAWQFGTVLTRFDLVLSDPLTALYYPSGIKEFTLGLLVFGGYVWWQHHRQRVTVPRLLAGLICIGSPALFLYYFIYESYGLEIQTQWLNWLTVTHHPLHIYQMFIHLPILLMIVANRHRLHPSAFVSKTMIGWGGAQWLLTFVDPAPSWFGMNISPHVYGLIVGSGTIWALNILMKEKKVFSWLKSRT